MKPKDEERERQEGRERGLRSTTVMMAQDYKQINTQLCQNQKEVRFYHMQCYTVPRSR